MYYSLPVLLNKRNIINIYLYSGIKFVDPTIAHTNGTPC